MIKKLKMKSFEELKPGLYSQRRFMLWLEDEFENEYVMKTATTHSIEWINVINLLKKSKGFKKMQFHPTLANNYILDRVEE